MDAMKFTRREFHLLGAAALAAPVSGQPPRRARKDCFLGMHFDLHPNSNDKALGRDVTEQMVKKFLDRVRPDFVQYDCKGHVGYLGYPSKVSTSAPIVKDSLRVWRRVTARRGVALYIHFSGVLDQLAVRQHPEWARVDADGKRSSRETSRLSSYVDERMIPQLEEAIRNYDIDGVWVDGECWGSNPDYSEASVRAFRKRTGIERPPRSPDEPGWQEWLEFNRQVFRDYVRHYLDALHAFRPGFQIASNWLYTTYVPERPELPVDFISGDYLGNACVSRARLEARYLSWVGKPWDLMAWGFQSGRRNPVGPVHKSAVQLMQEAAVVLAQGGGFQIYYQPTRAGRIDDRHIEVMARVARFCRRREALCHNSETVPEIGVLFSGYSLYHTVPKLFGGWGQAVHPCQGMVDALVEGHYPVDVIPDWRLPELAPRYPMIIVPDWPEIGAQARDRLLAYARDGGTLLIAGAENAAQFRDALQVRFRGDPRDQPAYVPGAEVFADVRGLWQDVEAAGAHVLETRFPTYDSTRDGATAATLARSGDGRIAAIYGPVGAVFAATHAPEARNFIARVVAQVFTPAVTVDGPPTVEVVRRKKGGKMLLHLINATGMQVASDYSAVDFIPPVGPVRIAIRTNRAPRRVTLEPGGRPLETSWRDGVLRTTLDRLAIHAILAWEA